MTGIGEWWRQLVEELFPERVTTRLNRIRHRLPAAPHSIRAVGILLAVVSLAFVGLVVVSFLFEGELAIVTKPFPLRLAIALPMVIIVLTVVSTVGAVIAWYRGYWTMGARVHYTMVAVYGLVFTWQLWELGFLQ